MVEAATSSTDSDNVGVAILICCLKCILDCIESLLEYLNQFGYVYVAVYGFSFIKSAKRVFNLIKQTGFESIVQYDLTGSALVAGAFVTGIACAIISGLAAYGLASSDDISDNWVAFAIIGLLVGFFFSYVIMQMLLAGINTIFVLWAEDPAGLFVNRPEEGKELAESTKNIPNLALDARFLQGAEAPRAPAEQP